MKYKSMGGLTVKDGRLINDRPNDVTGIAQAVQLKKAMHQAKKINTIAEGITLAEGREDFI
tara:strand:+ start:1035 stop:1217 length:183 start_codon:yes stop_codon:yes gene_type:complete